MKNHAILIPCQLRSVDENFYSFLDSSSTKAMIFIVTDRSNEEEALHFAYRYEADITFIDTAAESEIGIKTSDEHHLHPEFLKLEVILHRLVAWERRNDHRFEYIHRFRPDVVYPPDFDRFIAPLVNEACHDDHLLMSWSVIYSGKHDAMLKLLGHTAFQVKYRTDINAFKKACTQIDIQALQRSSNEWPFKSCFPVAILGSDEDIPSFRENIRVEYPSYIDAAECFIKRLRLESIPQILHEAAFSNNVNRVRCYYRRWQGAIPEHVFFYYLNYLGLSSGHYSTQSPLKYSRHATTPFTTRVFGQIQAKDYSFLDASHNWEMELTKFVQAGGKMPFAIQKLSYIEIEALSDHACQSLYKIIDMTGCSDWLFSYSEEFVRSILSRDVAPPESFKDRH